MTIIELEQAMRNLIATQPMVTVGSTGSVVNGVLSIIDAYRNLNYKIQTYPRQDMLKFNLSSDSIKMESDICAFACQVLQEKGINLLLYMAPVQNGYRPMMNQYNMMGSNLNQNMMMGQMMYSEPAINSNYNQMPPQPKIREEIEEQEPVVFEKPEPVKKAQPKPEKKKVVSKTKIKTTPKIMAQEQVEEVSKIPVEAPEQQAEEIVETTPAKQLETVPEKDEGIRRRDGSSGRDYLLELLKK